MKVLHVVPYLPMASGVTTFILEATEHLKCIGIDSEVAVKDWTRFKVPPSQTAIPRLKDKEALSRFGEFDIFHLHGIWPPFLHRFVNVAKENEIPLIWSLHGMLAPWALKHKWWKKFIPWYLWQKHDLMHSNFLHATSELEAKWIRQCGLTNALVQIPLGTHLPEKCPVRNHAEKILLFVGRINPVKGLENLILAWSRMTELVKERNWRLRIVGTDEAGYLKNLMSLVQESRMEEIVDFPGPKYGAELQEEYRRADLFVLPSFTENFGGVVIDALSWSLPVVASKGTPWSCLECGGDDERRGWWTDNSVEALEAVLRKALLLSDHERSRIGANGRTWVESAYSWPVVAESLKKTYLRMLVK